MENVVAARRLRKSMLNENNNYDTSYNINDININSRYIKSEKGEKESLNFIKKFKKRLFTKVFISVLVVFCCLFIKLLFSNEAKSNKYIRIMINEYRKDYSKEYIALKFEDLLVYLEQYLKYIIPQDDYNKFLENYNNNLKNKYINFDMKEKLNYLLKGYSLNNELVLNNANININEIEKNGVVEVFTKNVSNDDNVIKILEKKIDIAKPLEGKITSTYGQREKIFEDLDPYHTGIDIAANMGTEIKSATSGKVIKAVYNDKYYGNYVVVEIDGVTFKYAHMSEIKVNENDNINKLDVVGLVGSTGYSTGPHLHFEIAIDSNRVDPMEILEF